MANSVAPPLIDWSPLSNLYDNYRQARQGADRDRALEQLRLNPNMPYDQAARLLIGAGEITGGATLGGLQNQIMQRDLQQQQIRETGRHNQALEGHQGRVLAETTRQHDLDLMKPITLGAGLSGEIKGVRDPNAPGGYRIIDPSKLPTAGGGDTPQPRKDLPTGEDFLGTLQPNERLLIKKVGDYDISPKTFSNRGQRERILAAASQYNPDYDEKNYENASLTKKRFGSGGLEARTVRAMNVGIDHLETLEQAVDALANGDIRVINDIRNKFRTQFGSELPTNVKAIASIVGAEISKAIVGSQNALEDRKEIREQLTTSGSMPQLKGAIGSYKRLMAGQVKGLQKQYEASGLKGFEKLLEPATIKQLGLLDVNATGEVANPATPNQVVNWRSYFGGK